MKYILTNQYVKDGMTFEFYSPEFANETEKNEQKTRIVNNLEYILKSFDKKE